MSDQNPALDCAACVTETINTRRSLRRYDSKAVGKDKLLRLIETATCAPSPHNLQPWQFADLAAPDAQHRLAEAMAMQLRSNLRSDSVPRW